METIQLTITDKADAIALYRLLEPNAVCRSIWLELDQKMRQVGWMG
jgi:hypothetical protein